MLDSLQTEHQKVVCIGAVGTGAEFLVHTNERSSGFERLLLNGNLRSINCRLRFGIRSSLA